MLLCFGFWGYLSCLLRVEYNVFMFVRYGSEFIVLVLDRLEIRYYIMLFDIDFIKDFVIKKCYLKYGYEDIFE